MKRLLYNTTYHVAHEIVDEWEVWMINEFIPMILTAEGFNSHKLLKIMTDDQHGGISFAMQLMVNNIDDLVNYQEGIKKQLIADMNSKWGEKCLTFATLMEVVDEG